MGKKILSPEQEKFCQQVAAGSSLVDSYISAYPNAQNWKRESAHNKGCELSRRDYIAKRIDEIKEPLRKKAAKEFIYTQEMAVKVLARVSLSNSEKTSDVINATKALIDLLGFAAPVKTETDIKSSDGSMTPKPVIDVKKLSDKALEELLNAKIDK